MLLYESLFPHCLGINWAFISEISTRLAEELMAFFFPVLEKAESQSLSCHSNLSHVPRLVSTFLCLSITQEPVQSEDNCTSNFRWVFIPILSVPNCA